MTKPVYRCTMNSATMSTDSMFEPVAAMPLKSRLLVVDDHAIVREGLVSLLEGEPDIEVVGESDSAQAALQSLAVLPVDVVVLDLRMPGMSAVDAICALRAACADVKIVILTSFFEATEVQSVLRAGANGFLLKDALRDDILLAIRTVATGGRYIYQPVQNRLLDVLTDGVAKDDLLTQREGQVLQLIGEGLSNKRIAQTLGITEGTVKSYLRQLFPKIGVTGRLQAGLYARGVLRGTTR